MNEINPLDIAVIGMACYFPEADNIDEYWNNLSKGICSVKLYSDEELLNRGIDKEMINHPNYVKASPYFSRSKYFDASFFNVNPSEASILDPQRRLFIENCWQALEDAGYVPEKYNGKIGVFGSAGINFYIKNLYNNPDIVNMVGPLQIITGNEKDGLPTQTSYLLNLTGPSINVNTACSSSLVAIHLARQALLFGDADMVLAGGAAIIIPENVGYFYERDSILSRDGYCRAFDDDSDGTIWGSGSGVVLLKRLSDAVADGDHIRAVIKGSALNNDGSNKAGYTAPSIEGQSEVIVQAYASSGVSPETIDYIEAHGTGTKIGDPIEVAALTKAFREFTTKDRFCGLGSVKTNFGHLGAAAGIASFIKTVLALEKKQVPASLHFKKGNKNINFENSPFYVNTELCDMQSKSSPLRMGVSSLGVGGTNAHIILEEYCDDSVGEKTEKESVIILSAKNDKQLNEVKNNLLKYMEEHRNSSVQDIAYTLQVGRRDFKNKLAFYTNSIENAIDILKGKNPEKMIDNHNYQEKIVNNGNEPNNKLRDWFKEGIADWKNINKDEKRKRVSLPTYPLEKDYYWIESKNKDKIQEDNSIAHKINNMDEWFYYNKWNQTALPFIIQSDNKTVLKRLIFVDHLNFGYSIGEELKNRGEKAFYVYAGKEYLKTSSNTYEIDLENPESYLLLFNDLELNHNIPDSILHFFSLFDLKNENFVQQIDSILSFQKFGLYSFLYLIKAVNTHNITRNIQLFSFVNNVFDIYGNEKVYPEKSTIVSALKVIQQEYPNFRNRLIEINKEFLAYKDRVNLVVNEILSDNKDIVCSYRSNKRWVLNFNQIKLNENIKQNSVFKQKGVYFAFGGLTGGIPAIYEYIIGKYQAQLIIMDDPTLPKEKDWEDWLKNHGPNEIKSLKIKTVKKLKALGAEFIDELDIINDKDKLEKKIEYLEKQFGPINGVVHAAGGYAAGRIATLSYPADMIKKLCHYNLSSIGGSFVIINEIFKNKELDFRYLWTSISTVLAGPGFFAYCSADSIAVSAALDANNYLQKPWAVFNWDSLESEWFEDLVEENMAAGFQLGSERILEGLITTYEGNICLEKLSGVEAQFNPMIISCSDLYKRYDIWIKMDPGQVDSNSHESDKLKPRPELATPYEAPISENEKKIIAMMEKLLNIQPIGRKDSFFDLGGHSLLAIQLVTKIRETAQIDIGLDFLMNHQNSADISEYISLNKN